VEIEENDLKEMEHKGTQQPTGGIKSNISLPTGELNRLVETVKEKGAEG
jgi:hypothetical protein